MLVHRELVNRLIKQGQIASIAVGLMLLIGACQPKPPAERGMVKLPVYRAELVEQGRIAYQDACEQCHSLRPGSNRKAPQLMRVYGAPLAELSDYRYSDALQTKSQQGWHWTAENLDHYIADPKATIPDTRMETDKITDPVARQAIIAYLSTLR